MDIDTIQIILEALILLVLICASLYLAFFKSYFSEKGKNLATREDIARITTTVEEIKSDLDYSKQSKLSLGDEKRAALIDYYVSCCHWFNTLDNLPLGHIDFNRDNKNKCDLLVSVSSIKFENAKSKMELFVHDWEILEKNVNLTSEILDLQLICNNTMATLCVKNLERDLVEKNSSQENYYEKLKEKLGESKIIYQEYLNKKLELYGRIRPLQMELRDEVFKRIKDQY